MLYPSIDKLMEKFESKYSLVVATAKRARMLKDGSKPSLEDPKSHKAVGVALEEFYKGTITFENSPEQPREQSREQSDAKADDQE